MQNQTLNVDSLRNLIGYEVHYEGRRCTIIEVLEDGPHVILQHQELHIAIQPDQHGEAHRKVPRTVTLPVIEREGGDFHPAFKGLNLTHLL